MNYQVTNGQNIYDIALETKGTIEAAFEIIEANAGLNLSSVLLPGQIIVIPDSTENSDVEIANYFKDSETRLNSGTIDVTGSFNNDFNQDFE